MRGVVRWLFACVVLTTASCARTQRPAPASCDGVAAAERTLEGDLHVVYGDGPRFFLVMGARSAELRIAASARDTLLAYARRRVSVTGAVHSDSAIVCDARIRLAGTGS